jgi:mycothiol synthase
MVHHVEIKLRLSPADIADVTALLEAAAQADGHKPLGEHNWLDLVDGGRAGFIGLVARETDLDAPVGYAHVSQGRDSWSVELAVDPDYRRVNPLLGQELLSAALVEIAKAGGGHVHMWVGRPRAEHDQMAAAAGLQRGRELLQLRLNRGAYSSRLYPSQLAVRPFCPGRDEAAWLEVNNRAFDWHPEQGGWTAETLTRREKEPWFNPADMLLYETGDRLAGFCWTKVDPAEGAGMGEIYVLAVDPDFQGTGLGRSLVLAGLHHLFSYGLDTVMLYVDSTNKIALALYDDLGFEIDHLDRAYVADVPPAG